MCLRSLTRGFYAVSRVGRVPAERCWYPNCKINFAELVSRSSSVPQLHLRHRSDRSFLTSLPHPEQSCDVLYGSTKTTVRPALAALTLTISVNPTNCATRCHR